MSDRLRDHIAQTPWVFMGSSSPRIIRVSDTVPYTTDKYGKSVPKLLNEWDFPWGTTRIALVGKMHSGKSTVSEVFRSNGWDYSAFADAVKDFAVNMVNSETIQIMQYLGRTWTNITRKDLDSDKDKFRQLLQFVGNYGRQTYGEDVWLKIWKAKTDQGYWWRDKSGPGRGIYVDDCRYVNEAEFLRKEGFTLVGIIRDEKGRKASVAAQLERLLGRPPKKRELRDILNQPSETEVDDIRPHYVIHNDGSLADLRRVAGMLIGNPSLKPPARTSVLLDNPVTRRSYPG